MKGLINCGPVLLHKLKHQNHFYVRTGLLNAKLSKYLVQKFSSVQSLSCIWLFETPWTAARQASLSFIISWSLLKLMSIKSMMPSNHLILCHPLLLLPAIFPSIRVFSSESVLHIRWQSIGVSASTSVLPKNSQDWFPLRWTGWISLSKGLPRVFSITMCRVMKITAVVRTQ